MALSEKLGQWQDWDGAAFEVGRALGIFDEEDSFTSVKRVFWTNNPLGNALHEVLHQLTAAGVLELQDESDMQFRWSASGVAEAKKAG